jgi:hypothetical protein
MNGMKWVPLDAAGIHLDWMQESCQVKFALHPTSFEVESLTEHILDVQKKIYQCTSQSTYTIYAVYHSLLLTARRARRLRSEIRSGSSTTRNAEETLVTKGQYCTIKSFTPGLDGQQADDKPEDLLTMGRRPIRIANCSGANSKHGGALSLCSFHLVRASGLWLPHVSPSNSRICRRYNGRLSS